MIRTVCQGCHSECGVLVEVADNRIVHIEGDPAHPSSRGYICLKGKNQHHFLTHPDRIVSPLKRVGEKGAGKWARVSWEEALNGITRKLTEIRGEWGATSIGTFHGTAPRQGLFFCRFLAAALETPNVCNTDLHICYAPSMVSEFATFGASVMQEQGPDYRCAKCILVCGANPTVSHPPRGRDLLEGVRKNGARLIVVDPRRTKLAARADMFFQARPGSVFLVIMGMLHTVITEGLYDAVFVEKYCHGFDALCRVVSTYVPERLEESTWVAAADVRAAARLFATTRPAVIHHRVGVEQELNSTQTIRALNILGAITGNIGVKGGNLLPTPVPGFVSTGGLVHLSGVPADLAKKRLGADDYPLISGPDAAFLFVHPAIAARAMLEGKPYPLKALFLAGGNPVVNMQDTRRTRDAFKNLDLLVVNEFFMTPTAALADWVLPATMWPERDECCDEGYMGCVAARQQTVAPPSECRDDMQIAMDIVERLPWANRDALPWRTPREFNDFRVREMGFSFHAFKRMGYVQVPLQYRQYETSRLRTPTGKIELSSTLFEKYGYSPLPFYTENPCSPVSAPELLWKYPYILITGGRTMPYYLSAGRQIAALRRHAPDPLVELHPDTAAKENLSDGAWVWIETPLVTGQRVRFKVALTTELDPRVVHAQHGWWFPEKPAPDHGCFESNINAVLTDEGPREEICGSVALRAVLCRLYPVSE